MFAQVWHHFVQVPHDFFLVMAYFFQIPNHFYQVTDHLVPVSDHFFELDYFDRVPLYFADNWLPRPPNYDFEVVRKQNVFDMFYNWDNSIVDEDEPLLQYMCDKNCVAVDIGQSNEWVLQINLRLMIKIFK